MLLEINTYKVYWKNGTSEIVRGFDIADAFNKAGYSEKNFVDSVVKFSKVILPSGDREINALYSCKKCKSNPVVVDNGDSYTVKCEDCGNQMTDKADLIEEIIAKWNIEQAKAF